MYVCHYRIYVRNFGDTFTINVVYEIAEIGVYLMNEIHLAVSLQAGRVPSAAGFSIFYIWAF